LIETPVQRWELVGKGPDDTELLWHQIEIEGDIDPLILTVPQTSITVVEYRIE